MLIEKPRIPVREILLYGFLPNILKKLVYRLKGYKIGKDVSIGLGAVVCGEQVTIGDNTQIGFLTILRGKSLTIGSFVSIGSMTFIDTPYVEIGDGSKINEQVFIGGLQFPDSSIVIGKNCQIMQMSFINPAKSIVIGDDSGIGGHSLLFGHTSWLSKFEGYPVEFKPIEIGRSVSIAWRVFILPGVRIEDGAIVSANSLVHKDVPPRCLAAGFPARVVSKYPDFPKEVAPEQKVQFLEEIVLEMIDVFSKSGLTCEGNRNGFRVKAIRRTLLGRRAFAYSALITYGDEVSREKVNPADPLDVVVSLRAISLEMRGFLDARKITWIDIERKEQSFHSNDLGDEVLLFLRRYGVRFFRVSP